MITKTEIPPPSKLYLLLTYSIIPFSLVLGTFMAIIIMAVHLCHKTARKIVAACKSTKPVNSYRDVFFKL